MNVHTVRNISFINRLRRLSSQVDGWTALTVALLIVIAAPLTIILAGVFGAVPPMWHHIVETLLPRYVANSLMVTFGTGALGMVIGIATAWLVVSYEFPGRRVFEWALILPLAIPTYIAAYTYAGMLDYTGWIQTSLRHQFGDASAIIIPDIMSRPGVILVMALVLYPYVYVLARTSFARQSGGLLNVAAGLGRPVWVTFFLVALPLARPAIVGGVALVMMETLNDYGAVKYYGVDTFTTGIFRAWFDLDDVRSAIRLCAYLMLVVLAILGLERWQRGRARFNDDCAMSANDSRRIRLKRGAAWIAALVCALPLAFGFLIPVGQLAVWGVQTAGQVVNPEFTRLTFNSFALAAAAAAVIVTVCVVIVYTLRLHDWAALRQATRVAAVGYAVPGAVIAIGVMLLLAWLDRGVGAVAASQLGRPPALLLSGSLLALLFAYLVRFLAVAYNPVESGFVRLCGCVDEASRSLGVSPLRTLLRADLPLLKGTVAAAMILAFVDILKELPLTLILRPFNFDTLATRAFELASEEMLAESAGFALIIIAAGAVPILILNRLIVRGGN